MYNYISVCGSLNVAIIKSLRKQKKKKGKERKEGRRRVGGRKEGKEMKKHFPCSVYHNL